MYDDDMLLYGTSETLYMVKASKISDYGANLYDSVHKTEMDEQSSSDFFVPESYTVSGIIDSTIRSRSSSETPTDIDEYYVDYDMSSVSIISDIKVSSSQRKHVFERERVERKGNIYDKLYNACLKGHISIIKDILERHNTTSMIDELGQTALYAACIGNHVETVNFLTDFGYNVNHQDNEGKTPLHIAFENHLPDLAQTLIRKFSSDTELRDVHNFTPLHTAIDRGYYSYSQELLQKCQQQDLDSEVSWIHLHASCFLENVRGARLLLDANTDVNHVSSAGYKPLHIAVRKSNIDLINLLLDYKVDVNSSTVDGETPLHIAVTNCEEAIIQKLLAQNADPSLKDAPGNTSLHLAVQVQHGKRPGLVKTGASFSSPFPAAYHACSVQTVQAMITHGADVNALNKRGQTALWFACCDGQGDFVKLLLDKGADPNIVDKHGDSCLHAAIFGHCSIATLQEIIDRSADVNAVNKDGATPLLLACSTGQSEAVKFLLNANADPNTADVDGDVSLHAAIAGYCSSETLQILIDSGADVNAVNKRGRTAVLLGCLDGQMDSVKVLLDAGADPTIADEEHFSCLHAAIDGRCSIDILQALIDHGAHVDAKRKDGMNALLQACKTGQSESVLFLLNAGADVSTTGPNDDTILHEAVHGHCSQETLQKIVGKQGVIVNAVNKNRQTALTLACKAAQTASIHLLLKNGADPNICDTEGFTSLLAAVHGHCTIESLNALIIHAVDVDAQNNDGHTAMWLACINRQQSFIKILLKAKSNPNIASTDGNTVLHAAVVGGCSKNIVQALIDHGANVNATNRDNVTSLMIACQRGDVNTITKLLRAGADPDIISSGGMKFVHFADAEKSSIEAHKSMKSQAIYHGVDVNAENLDCTTALMIACQNGDGVVIKILLDAGADPNINSIKGNKSLHAAVLGGCSEEAFKKIIDHGADVNSTNNESVTALMVACKKGNMDAMYVLLNAGADPHIADSNGNTCMHHAIVGGCSKEVLQVIIDHGADVNSTNNDSVTALMVACKKGNVDATYALLKAASNPDIADSNGNTCMYHAIVGSFSKEVLQAIIDQGADVNSTNKEGVTALMAACRKGNMDVIYVLLKAGVDPHISDSNGNTWIHHAIVGGCNETIQEIINHGAHVNATNKDNITPLILACQDGNEVVIKTLLDAGADPYINSVEGHTSLHAAVLGGCSNEALHKIIDYGVDVNATNILNQTALELACQMGNVYALNALYDSGADSSIVSVQGNTLLHVAVLHDCRKEVLMFVIHHSVDVNATNNENESALLVACQKGNLHTINILLDSGADPSIASTEGNTCLHYAVDGRCSKKVLQAIIDIGADVNATNKEGVTALMVACKKGNVDATYVLLQAGADLRIADCNGNTCMHHAIVCWCNKETIQAMINHGADVNATNQDSVTSLVLACQIRNEVVIKVLLDAGADPNIVSSKGNTSLHAAVLGGCSKEALQKIIEYGADVNATNQLNQTALELASQKGDDDALNVLREAESTSSSVSIKGNTLLHAAVLGDKNKQVLLSAIHHGADVNATNSENESALLLASRRGNLDIIHALLSSGADPTIASVEGNTWLHYAVNGGCSIEVLTVIVGNGADVNATNNKNESALLLASQEGNLDTINILLESRADPNITSAEGNTWLHYAVDGRCSKEVFQAIIDHGADVNSRNKDNVTALMVACKKRNSDAINVLLNAGANPRLADTNGDTCMHHAVVGSCSKDTLQAIINHGGGINAVNNDGATALLVACNARQMESVNVLLRSGADATVADANGDTCLHIVLQGEYNHKILQMLLDHGVHVNATNKNHQTAYMLASSQGNTDAMHALLNAQVALSPTSYYGESNLHHTDDTCSLTTSVSSGFLIINRSCSIHTV